MRRIPDDGQRLALQNGLKRNIEDSLKYSTVAFGPNVIGPIPYHLPTEGIRQQAHNSPYCYIDCLIIKQSIPIKDAKFPSQEL